MGPENQEPPTTALCYYYRQWQTWRFFCARSELHVHLFTHKCQSIIYFSF